jgi:hypothetical protein
VTDERPPIEDYRANQGIPVPPPPHEREGR